MDCVICHRVIKGNIHPGKIVTCGRCVQIFLTASRERKNEFIKKLKAEGRHEEAKAVQDFISPEGDSVIATFEKTVNLRRSKAVRRCLKPHSSYLFRKIRGKLSHE